MARLREFVDRWFDEVWGRRRAERIDEWVAPDCRIHGLPEAGPTGPAGFRPFYELLTGACVRIDVRIEDSIEAGDKIAVRWRAALEMPDGRTHSVRGGGMYRIRDGRFVEAWDTWDPLALLVDMGVVSPSAFAAAFPKRAPAAATGPA